MGRGEESCRKMAASGSQELKGLEHLPEAEGLGREEAGQGRETKQVAATAVPPMPGWQCKNNSHSFAK